jgi:hypothetical protein
MAVSFKYWPSQPAVGAVAVTPNDSTEIPNLRALYIGGSGNLKVTCLDGSVVTFSSLPVGILPLSVRVVWSNGTTATNIVGLF